MVSPLFQTLGRYKMELCAAIGSSFCLQVLHFCHFTAQSQHRSSQNKSLLSICNKGSCSSLTRKQSNLTFMIRQNGGLSQPDQIKTNLSSYSHSSFLFPLGGLDFYFKDPGIKGVRTWQDCYDLNPDVCTCSSKK